MQRLKEENSKLMWLASQKQMGKDWELLSTMTDVIPNGDCVHKETHDDEDGDVVQYMYRVGGGALTGLRFTLVYISWLEEYMYQPVECPESMQQGSDFSHILNFPEHMLQKFFHKFILSD